VWESQVTALPVSDKPITEADYLAFERTSEIKHEFIDGEIYAMTGASPNHNLVVASTIAAIHNQLRGKPCKIYPSDMKVRTPSTGSYLYPDISVVCGESQFDDEQRDILLNPTIIIEVLSPNTERYDRGKKFQSYRELASMQEYILIAQDSPHIERFVRQQDGLWQFSEARGLEASLDLASIMCKLALVEVYEQVDFDSVDETEESND
jgi:Uma2 family endonuclease